MTSNSNSGSGPSWEEVVAKAPTFLTTHFGKQVGEMFMDYCKEEDFDDVALVIDDIESWDDSSIIETIADELNWTDDQRQKLWKKLRILCQIDSGVTMPDDLTFELSQEEEAGTKAFMDEQCPGMFGFNIDKVLRQAIAIGRKNEVPLLPLMYDLFTKFKLERALRQKAKKGGVNKAITAHDWEEWSRYLSEHKKDFGNIVLAVQNYQARMFNPLMLSTPVTYFKDSASEFLDIALAACNMIDGLIKGNHALPLHVDVWVIPKATVEGGFDMVGGLDLGDDDDDEDEDEEEDDVKETDAELPDELGPIEALLQQGKIPFELGSINVSSPQKSVRTMREQLDKVVKEQRSTRCVLVIDRRDTGPSGLATDNKIVAYTPPEAFSKISKNYCQEQLIHHTLKFICPSQSSDEDSKASVNAGMDAFGRMCCFSFHVHTQDHVVAYWYVQGSGARFWPSYFIDIFPQFFRVSDLEQKKIDQNYVKKNLKLEFKDKQFSEWDKVINAGGK